MYVNFSVKCLISVQNRHFLNTFPAYLRGHFRYHSNDKSQINTILFYTFVLINQYEKKNGEKKLLIFDLIGGPN